MAATDFTARANRAAAELLAAHPIATGVGEHDRLVSLLAMAWLHGYKHGTDDTMREAEQAMKNLVGDLVAAIPV